MSLRGWIGRFWRDEDGTTIVEMAIVLPLFLVIFFAIIDFGRLWFHYVNVEKAVQIGARIAAVRPAACAGVPDFNVRAAVDGAAPARTGTECNAGQNICLAVPRITCNGSAENGTAAEIWDRINPVFPSNTTIGNLNFAYDYDPDLGFLGGPYVPVVTVEITNAEFEFLHPLAALIGLAGGGGSTVGGTVTFPDLSVSLPGEDLAQGVDG